MSKSESKRFERALYDILVTWLGDNNPMRYDEKGADNRVYKYVHPLLAYYMLIHLYPNHSDIPKVKELALEASVNTIDYWQLDDIGISYELQCNVVVKARSANISKASETSQLRNKNLLASVIDDYVTVHSFTILSEDPVESVKQKKRPKPVENDEDYIFSSDLPKRRRTKKNNKLRYFQTTDSFTDLSTDDAAMNVFYNFLNTVKYIEA
jgi:DNA-binding protein